MDLGLEGRVYVVTGGSKGSDTPPRRLTADGARVVISARDPDRLAGSVDRAQPGRGR
jgi:3-oxoacyl-[acyl-carrier protein] reductase